MEEYIRLEEEKAQRYSRTFNWQTATYDKMEYCEEEDDSLTKFETKYPAIVFDDTSNATLSCEPTVRPLNENEINFRISFDESDDEGYMVILDKNSFSYKIISVDNLKMDSENENDKVNMPSSPEPTISHSNDLVFFKDFENIFPTIAYNDNLTFKLDHLTEPSINMASLPSKDQRHPWLMYQLGGVRRRMTWRQFILALGLHTDEEMAEAGDFLGPTTSYVFIRDPVRRLCYRMISCSISGRGQAPEMVIGVDIFYLWSMDQGTANVSYLLAQYLFRHTEGKKSGARLSRGHIIGCLAAHFEMVSDHGIMGLSVVTRELPLIDLHELGRLNISAEDAPAVDKGCQANPAPAWYMELRENVVVGRLRGDVARSFTDQGSSRLPYQRRTRRRTGDASTSAP
ncbi:hypothetical protein Tco_0986754 [Tanacetum coccineum]